MSAPTSGERSSHQVHRIVIPPPVWIEYAFYFTVSYTVMGPALGLEIPLLAGALILGLSVICIIKLKSVATIIYGPIALLLACVVSFSLVQVLVHGESILGGNVRSYIIWILHVLVVQSLCLRRGFPLRFPLVLFAIGAVTLPFIGLASGGDEMARVDLEVQGGLSHPAGLAVWFGFCAIYFVIVGLKTNRKLLRIGACGLAVACLLIVTLTVERGPLFGAVLAITVALRGVLKRGFAPVLGLVVLAGIIFASGLFDRALSQYTERGMEDTGREELWREGIARFSNSPFVGVGESNVPMKMGNSTKEAGPHNSFLRFALSSGIIPFALFFVFWARAGWRALFSPSGSWDDAFRLPYFLFTLTSLMLGDTGFMNYNAILTTALVSGSGVLRGTIRIANFGLPVDGSRRYRHRAVNTQRSP